MRERLEELDRLWRRINHSIMDTIRQTVHEHSLPAPFRGVMGGLMRSPGVTVSELARHTMMAKSHVSKTVDRLVELGLAEKKPDPADRRLVRVFATDKAHEEFRRIHARVLARWAVVVSTMSESESDALIHGLRGLDRAMSGLTEAPAPADAPPAPSKEVR